MAVRFPFRRVVSDRLVVAGLALALLALTAVPGGAIPGGSAPPSACDLRRAAATLEGASASDTLIEPRTGLDLELRVLHLRVEFPWMRKLPISPGHHIVISLLARDPDDRRR